MALEEPAVGLFGRITTDNTLPERDSEGANPQRELRNVRPNSLEKAMRSEEASEEAGQKRARKRDRSDIAKSGEFSAFPYCQ